MGSHIDTSRWQKLTLFEQMGNAGSEVGRAFAAQKRGDIQGAVAALSRGLDLLDATANSHPTRSKEILRAREQFAEKIIKHQQDDGLEKYFMQFAVAARLKR